MSSLRTINSTETGEDSKEDAELEELKTAREEEQAFGERLLDDLMNIFCDKLQRAAQEQKRTIDGLLAIQYITVSCFIFYSLLQLWTAIMLFW